MEIEAGGKGDKRKAKPSAVYIWQQEFRVGVGAVWRTAPNSFDSNAVQSKLASPHHKYITHDFHPVKGKQFDGGNQSSSTRRELTASWCRVKLRSLFVPVPVPVPVSYSYSVLGRTGCTVPTVPNPSRRVGCLFLFHLCVSKVLVGQQAEWDPKATQMLYLSCLLR